MQLSSPCLQPLPLQQKSQPSPQQVTILAATPLERVRINLQQLPPLQSKVGPPPTLKMQTVLVPPTVESSPEQLMTCTLEAHMVETSPETTCAMITDAVPEMEVSSDER